MRWIAAFLCCVMVTGCATQRFGRLSPVSEAEKQSLTCREIKIEIAKANEFLFDVKKTRKSTNGAHVLGFLGDFGIGNTLEGDDAELSGEVRLKGLNDLSVNRGCDSAPPAPGK